MVMIGGRPTRAHVTGETRRAISAGLFDLAIQSTGDELLLRPASRSVRSVTPYQLTMPATFGSGVFPVGSQGRSSPAPARAIPVIKASSPPDESPITTMRSG